MVRASYTRCGLLLTLFSLFSWWPRTESYTDCTYKQHTAFSQLKLEPADTIPLRLYYYYPSSRRCLLLNVPIHLVGLKITSVAVIHGQHPAFPSILADSPNHAAKTTAFNRWHSLVCEGLESFYLLRMILQPPRHHVRLRTGC